MSLRGKIFPPGEECPLGIEIFFRGRCVLSGYRFALLVIPFHLRISKLTLHCNTRTCTIHTNLIPVTVTLLYTNCTHSK